MWKESPEEMSFNNFISTNHIDQSKALHRFGAGQKGTLKTGVAELTGIHVNVKEWLDLQYNKSKAGGFYGLLHQFSQDWWFFVFGFTILSIEIVYVCT